jgi:hypothetical protein
MIETTIPVIELASPRVAFADILISLSIKSLDFSDR